MVEPWKSLSHNPRDNGRRTLVDATFELPNGQIQQFPLFHIATISVCVLAVTNDQKILLARQFRPGPGKIFDELPGGGVDEGELPETAARRELLEETGYACEELTYLGRPYECGYSTVVRHAYLATGCYRQSEQKLDQNEFVDLVLKPLPEFIDQLVLGDCTDPEIGWMGLFRAGYITADMRHPK